LDVKTMELPPGFRGYGTRNIVEHPDTEARQAEVDAARDGRGDRRAMQESLMPFRQLLPAKYRTDNERVCGPLP